MNSRGGGHHPQYYSHPMYSGQPGEEMYYEGSMPMHEHVMYSQNAVHYPPLQAAYPQQPVYGSEYYGGWNDSNPGYYGEVVETWHETLRIAELQVEVSKVAFDPLHELLWIGYQHGRLTSYAEPSLEKYTSFMVSDSPVRFISCFAGGILSGGGSHLSLRNRGGVVQQKYIVPASTPSSVVDISTATFLEASLPQANDSYQYSHFAIGGSFPSLLSYDIARGGQPISTLNLSTATTALTCGRMLATGGINGTLSLTDSRMRSTRVEFSFAMHSGRINDIEMVGDYIVTCGMSSRSINPYDKNAPKHSYPDSSVQVIDMRMMRKAPPLNFPSAKGVSMLTAINHIENAVAIASEDGTAAIFDVANNAVISPYLQVGDGEEIRSVCASSTGDMLVFGGSTGVAYHFAERDVDLGVNISSMDVVYPTYPPPPPQIRIMPSDPSPASQYIILHAGKKNYRALSDFPKWADKTVIRPVAKKRINKNVLKNVRQQDFLGYITNPGIRSNSLLFGNKGKILEECDPRANDAEDVEIDLRRRMSRLKSSDFDVEDDGTEDIPKRYQFSELKLSRRGLDDFDFGKYNQSEFVGLENSHPNSYTNPVLLLLYFIPEVRNAMIEHSCLKDADLNCELGFLFHMLDKSRLAPTKDRSCQSSNLLRAFKQLPEAVALGLLTDTVPLSRRIEMFHRFLLAHVDMNPNAAVSSKPTTSPSSDDNCKIMEKMFGYTTLQTTRCPNGHTTTRNPTTMVLELNYADKDSARSSATSTATPLINRSFSEILQSSFSREAKTRAWCDECKEYQPILQKRSPITFPEYLSIQCNLSSDRDGSVWTQENVNGGVWLPPKIAVNCDEDSKKVNVWEFALAKDEDQEGTWTNLAEDSLPEETPKYELVAIVSHVHDAEEDNPKRKNGHLVLHVQPPRIYFHDKQQELDTPPWYLFNDFRVSGTSLLDAISFECKWKNPCILIYKRITPDIQRVQALATIPEIDESILHSPSLSKNTSLHPPSFVKLSGNEIPGKNDIVAIDSEFVTIETEESAVKSDGSRVILRESRQALARISCLHGDSEVTFIDDYVVPSEPVIDYLTRFSGLVADDLDPTVSPHHLVSLKSAYLKLRFLVDRGCVFVGHGLKKDFRTINIYVPPEQIIDTVELFHLPEMRKISLRFLAAYVLDSFIQSDTHDSIEDARTALQLYKKYNELKENGSMTKYLHSLYEAGRICKWQVTDALKEFRTKHSS